MGGPCIGGWFLYRWVKGFLTGGGVNSVQVNSRIGGC